MKVSVTENKLIIQQDQILNENEYNIHKIEFDFSSEYTDDLVKVALFTKDNLTYKKIISNNECDIPPEILQKTGYSILGVYAYKTEQDTLILRYSPTPTKISVFDGSYKAEAENSEPITPSEIEQYQQILQNSLQQFQNQYNTLVEETEGDIQAIEDELQRKVDEGYFDGEDGFSPIAKVIQKSNGATIEIEDKNGKTTADVYNGADGKDGKDGQDGQDGYTPQRGIDYWTEEDKEEIKEETIAEIDDKIEEYNTNAAQKVQQYNSNATQKTTDYNTNASQKLETYNQNHTTKLNEYNINDTEKTSTYNSNAETKTTAYNQNAASKLNTYNENHTTKLGQYNTNATEKTNTFDTNATNKLNAYNTNAEQKVSEYNQNANEKTEDFDAHTEEIQDNIEKLQTENERLKATLPTTTGEGQDITLNKTAELEFIKPPLPRGNSEQESTTGKNKFSSELEQNAWNNSDGTTTVWSNQYIRSKDFVEVKSNTTYTLNYTMLNNDVKNGNILLYDENKSFINSLQTPNNLTFTTSATTRYLKFNFYAGAGANINDMSKLQLEEGSTATPYEPYTNGASPNPDYPQEITNVTGDVEVKVQNKNLFEITENIRLSHCSYVSGANTNEYKLLCTDGDMYANEVQNAGTFYDKSRNGNLIPCKYGETVYFDTGNSLFTKNFFTEFDENFMSLGYKDKYISNGIYTPINQNCAYVSLRFGYGINAVAGTTYTLAPIICKTSNTVYTPHQEQILPLTLGNIELCKIGDYQDYFYKESNKWYLHKAIEKVIFDGSESWNRVMSTNNAIARFGIITIDYLKGLNTGKIPTFMSNYFIPVNFNTVYDGISGGISWWWNDNIKQLILCLNDDRSLENFKTWLSTHNTIVYYVLETPTDTEITDTTLISQLEAINKALSYEEQTNISSNTIALFNVEAYQSTKLVLEENNAKYESLEARVALLE